jgi:PIN domain nuclease of toxin-antitoxin system
VVLLDTHVLIWLRGEPRQIGSEAFSRIESAMAAGEAWLSAISFWEVAMLARKRRIKIAMPLAKWRAGLAARAIREIPIDGVTAAQAGEIDWEHGDPADRIIVATAIRFDLTLITADRRILSWRGLAKQIDARA